MATAYYNGEYCDFCDVRIPLTDRCVFFGDGIYDAVIGKNGGIYLENNHISRFCENSKKLKLNLGMNEKELSEILHNVIRKSGFEEYFIYFQLTRSLNERRHEFGESKESNLLITIKPHTMPSKDTFLKLITTEDIRYRMCNMKTLNILPSVLASQKAHEAGCDEAVFHREGVVTECAHSNILIVKDGVLKTHPDCELILPGIMKSRLLFLAREMNIHVEEKPFTLQQLYSADEILVSATGKLCLRANIVDKKVLKESSSNVGKLLIEEIFDDYSKSMQHI